MAKPIYVGLYDDPDNGTTLFTRSLSDQLEHTIELLYNHLKDTGVLDPDEEYATNMSDQIDAMYDTVNARIIDLGEQQVTDLMRYVTYHYYND